MNYLKGCGLIMKLATQILPMADKELDHWSREAADINNEELKKQALDSINQKKFHIQGGCVYALYPGADTGRTVKFVTALQTISDYLDNLCDRVGVYDTKAFNQLHLSLLDAVDPGRPLEDYYRFYSSKDDGDYLKKLVNECRNQLEGLPSYHLVLPVIKKYIKLYSELQTYKHTETGTRLPLLTDWAREPLQDYSSLNWWEFAAAAGSTLGIFLLYALSFNPELTQEEVVSVDRAYFPWVCGLHILLDYFIDYQEDLQMGDLNFTYYYDNLAQCEDRMAYFVSQALDACSSLKYPDFHETVIKGLLALYLSDPKAISGFNRITAQSLLNSGSKGTQIYYKICRFLRICKII